MVSQEEAFWFGSASDFFYFFIFFGFLFFWVFSKTHWRFWFVVVGETEEREEGESEIIE